MAATTLNLSKFVMLDGYTIREEGNEYLIQYLMVEEAGAVGTAPEAEVVGTRAGAREEAEEAAAGEPVPAGATVVAVAAAATRVDLTSSVPIQLQEQTIPFIPNYVQPQITALGCGRFALNNLLHNKQFSFDNRYSLPYSTTVSSFPIAEHIEDAIAELTALSKTTTTPINLDAVCKNYEGVLSRFAAYGLGGKCQPDEFFDGEVLKTALNIIGHKVENASIQGNSIQLYTAAPGDPIGTRQNTETMPNLLGYIINYNRVHWVCIRKLPDGVGPSDRRFQYLNSQYPKDIAARTFVECLAIINANTPTQVYVVSKKESGVNFINPAAFEMVKDLAPDASTAATVNKEDLKTFVNKVYEVYKSTKLGPLMGFIDSITPENEKKLKKVLSDPDLAFELLSYINSATSPNIGVKLNKLDKPDDLLKDMREKIKSTYGEPYTFLDDAYLNNKTVDDLLKIDIALAADSTDTITNAGALDAALSKANPTTPTAGGNRRKTLRLQARQKPGRRALSHKQVHHKQNENA